MSVALVGYGETALGIVPNRSPLELTVDATLAAIDNAGLARNDIDGLITCNSLVQPIMYHAEATAEYLGLRPRHCFTVGTGGGTTYTAIRYAAAAIAEGLASTVVVAMADSMRSFMTRDQAMIVQASAGHPAYEQPYGPSVPAYYALIARAHMAQFGTTEAQFAEAMVSSRAWAAMNPTAQYRELVTADDVLASRPIADPLKLLDCSIVSDGGGAVVLMSAERAADVCEKPIQLLGFGEGHAYEHVSQAQDLTTSAAVMSGQAAFEQAGIGPADVDLAQLYDCFTPALLIQLEDLGFCEKGAGGQYLQSGITKPGGALPVNTHGGMLSHCHPGNPGAFFGLTEAIRQLWGQAGERQQQNLQHVLLHAQGGIMSSHATLIIGAR
ncbi:thiolase family protein [bacterium]|nr:thiolase family protein [bacterium]